MTLREVEAVVDRYLEMERARTLRAALIAATIMNTAGRMRPAGAPAVKPSDFIREAPREEDYMSVEETRSMLNRWAADVNAHFADQQREGAIRESPHE